MRILVALSLAASCLAVLAGCTNAPPTTPGVPGTIASGGAYNGWAEAALAAGNHHDHRDWSNHTGRSTPNFMELGHDPLTIPAQGNQSAGGYFCGGAATTPDGRRLSIISSYAHDSSDNVAFVLVDTTDPAHPKHLGDYILPGTLVYDVDITPDGAHAVIGADVPLQDVPSGQVASPTALLHPQFRDACTGQLRALAPQPVPTGPSTILVSLADPMDPTYEDAVPAPAIGPHSVSTALIGTTTYVASSTTNLAHHGSYFQFFQVLPLPTGAAKLVLVSAVDSGQYGATAVANGHIDAEIAMHPVLNKPVVYLSDWDGGVVVLDFSNPAAPLELGTWADQGADNGALHSTRSLEGTHNGHHYLLAGQEFTGHPVNRPSGWIYILDDTDPAHIKNVGRWTLPVDVQANWGGVELYSTHYFRAVNDTVFVAMYHGGVWAFKLDFDHPDNLRTPPSVGVFMPDQAPVHARAATSGYDYEPFVLDVFPDANDNLVVYDGLSGVYSVHYDAAKDMVPPTPWPFDGKQL